MDLLPENEDSRGETESSENTRKFTLTKVDEGFDPMKKVLECFKDQDPDMEQFAKVSSIFRDAATCYSTIRSEKKKRITAYRKLIN